MKGKFVKPPLCVGWHQPARGERERERERKRERILGGNLSTHLCTSLILAIPGARLYQSVPLLSQLLLLLHLPPLTHAHIHTHTHILIRLQLSLKKKKFPWQRRDVPWKEVTPQLNIFTLESWGVRLITCSRRVCEWAAFWGGETFFFTHRALSDALVRCFKKGGKVFLCTVSQTDPHFSWPFFSSSMATQRFKELVTDRVSWEKLWWTSATSDWFRLPSLLLFPFFFTLLPHSRTTSLSPFFSSSSRINTSTTSTSHPRIFN